MASKDEHSREIYQYYIKVDDTPHTSQNSVTNISNILRYSSGEEAKQTPKQQVLLSANDQQQQSAEPQHTRTILSSSTPVQAQSVELLPVNERENAQHNDEAVEENASTMPEQQQQRSISKVQNRRASDYLNSSPQPMDPPATTTFQSPHAHITPASTIPSQIPNVSMLTVVWFL